jgi:uncharacterized protein (DUF362 family)
MRAAGTLALLPTLGLDGLARTRAPRSPSRIALVRTSDRRRGVTAALKLLDLGAVAGRRVVLKPNFNSADDTPASTHNDTLAQLVTELHERGARSITLGESSGPPQTRGVMEKKGTFDLARDLRFDVVDYEQMPENGWVPFKTAGSHWPEGFFLPRLIVDSEYTVSTCCLKTHGFGGVFTMSLKLAVGLTPKRLRRSMHASPDMRRMIAELNTGYKPDLIVLDGVHGRRSVERHAESGQRRHRGARSRRGRCRGARRAEIARRERRHHGPRRFPAGADRARRGARARRVRAGRDRPRDAGRGERRVRQGARGHSEKGLIVVKWVPRHASPGPPRPQRRG